MTAKQHSPGFLRLAEDARTRVREIPVADVMERVGRGATLLDVREESEWDAGHARGAEHLGKGVIERDIETRIPHKQTEVILYCGGGYRSALAADAIQKMGYSNVFSLEGGWRAWESAGAPIDGEDMIVPPPA